MQWLWLVPVTALHTPTRAGGQAGGGLPPSQDGNNFMPPPVGKHEHNAQACSWACGLWRRPNRRAACSPCANEAPGTARRH